MTLQSMTGFARNEGVAGGMRWVWELRAVNGKSLDLRMRLPSGTERFEPEVRRLCQEAFSRGNIQISLSITRESEAVEAHVNEAALAAVLDLVSRLNTRLEADPPRLDGILNIRGILEFREPAEDPVLAEARDRACLAGLAEAVNALRQMREGEGRALASVLAGHLDAMEAIVARVEADPSRTPAAIRARLAAQVALLTEASRELDPARLHAEAVLLATRADLREEIDRLFAHIAASRELIEKGGPVGRRLDFLAQEFNRESNTICSKSNAAAVTAAGLDLKVLVDQFREQVQNLE